MSKALATKKVAAALLGFGMVLAFAGTASAQTTTASTLSTLQAQVQALLAQIAALQGSGTSTGSGGACFTFTMDEHQGSSGGQVMWVQEFLNGHGFAIAASGAGSPGNESSYFGGLTKAAVMKFQSSNGISPVSGYWGPLSRAKANAVCAGSTSTGTGTGTGTGTVTSGPGITVTAGVQPANSLAPEKASRVQFTTFTLTNNTSAAVTINGITVQRTGLANDNAFAGVILLDSTGLQYGNSQTFNSNHQATVGGTFTLNPGQSTTYTIAGNMETSALGNSGQVASISVVSVNTSVPVSGTLPITGAQQTINETLAIGTATVGLSGYDPDSHRSEPIGTTGLTFSAIRVTAGSAEDEKLYSITWNQTGSAGSSDISNLTTVVNGTSYPITVDSTGKYYTSQFPGGILITKGNSVDAYIQGDVTGSNASGRTAEFDIYRSSDIYVVGQTYGFGITPTETLGGANTSGANTTSGGSNTTNPFYFGTYMSITGGTLSTVSSASSVAPQNIAVNVPNQILGGFQTNFTGEPVTVQSLTVHVASSTPGNQLTNVTLVDSNGNVVAGPVDEVDNTATIDFSSSMTFPVGPMTYTIKGTVITGTPNGVTYTLSTNPSADWASPIGQTSGSNLSLTNTLITMSTMTVQAGQLNISAASSPAATNITTNTNNYTIANIVLDASQSGEDVRLNSLPVVVSATGTITTTASNSFSLESNLTNCQLYNGSTVLNSQSVGSSQWGAVTNLANTGGDLSVDGVEANFTFTNSLTVPKGTTVTLALQCNIGGALYTGETFSAGADTNYKPTATGATSGNTITPTVSSGTSGKMTVGTATMTASVPTPLSYTQVAGGTQNVTVGTFTLQPTSGSVSLQNIGLALNQNYASSSDISNGIVTIWNGSTQVGTANFSGKSVTNGNYYVATSTISSFNLPQNVQTTFTLKANIATIGTGQSGMSGHEIKVGLAEAQGTSGNTSVDTGFSTSLVPTTGIGMFESYPTVALTSYLPSNGIADGRLIAFSITANANNPVGIGALTFGISTSSINALTGIQLYAYTDSGFSQPAGGTTGGIAGSTAYNGALQVASTTFSTALEIPAGTTEYFLLKGTVSPTGTTYNIATTLRGDSTDLAPAMYSVAGVQATSTVGNVIWSPNSTTTSSITTNDWTNGFGLVGLPSIGITENRTN